MIVVGKENLMFRAYRGTTSKNVQKVVVSMFYAKLEYSVSVSTSQKHF